MNIEIAKPFTQNEVRRVIISAGAYLQIARGRELDLAGESDRGQYLLLLESKERHSHLQITHTLHSFSATGENAHISRRLNEQF